MAEYHKMMHMDEVEPDALDEYLSINEEDVSTNWISFICSEKRNWRPFRRAFPKQPGWLL